MDSNNFRKFRGLGSNDNFEVMFEHWLREIAKMLKQEETVEQSRNERFIFNLRQQNGVTLEAFLHQVAIVLRDEFEGTVIQNGNTLLVQLADNDTFCLQITKDNSQNGFRFN